MNGYIMTGLAAAHGRDLRKEAAAARRANKARRARRGMVTRGRSGR
jgi:hypothetical protein